MLKVLSLSHLEPSDLFGYWELLDTVMFLTGFDPSSGSSCSYCLFPQFCPPCCWGPVYYFIALRTQVNLPNSILFSISPKWAWTIPAFPSCCKEFITMHKQSTYHSACKLAVCVQEMRAVITDNKVMVFLVTDCCSGSRTYYQSLKKSLFFFCHMYRFLAISCG